MTIILIILIKFKPVVGHVKVENFQLCRTAYMIVACQIPFLEQYYV